MLYLDILMEDITDEWILIKGKTIPNLEKKNY